MDKKTNNWKTKKLGEVCKLKNGFAFKSDNYLDNGIPVIRISDIKDGLIVPRNTVYVSEDSVYDNYIINENEIIVAMSGATTGKFGIYKSKEKAYQNQRVGKFDIIDKKQLDNNFLLHQLHSLKRQIEKDAYGGAQPNISSKKIEEMEIVLPPLETQQAIVSKIEELFSELDKGIAELKTAQLQLKTYRQSVLKSAFEGKLTEEWRKNNVNIDSVESLIYNLKNDKKNLKTKTRSEITDEEQNELFSIPNSWKWIRNEEYLYEVKDGTHDTPKYISDGIPFVTQKNIKNSGLTLDDIQYISEEEHKKYYQRSNVTKGDILISMIGHNRGMSVIVDTDRVFSIKNVGLFKFNHKYQLNKFSYYFYQSKVALNIILKKSKGGAQPFIGLTELRNWPVVVCSLEEQHQIVEEIESRLSVADKMEQSIQESLLKAEALRQSILKKAFSGELV